MACHSANVTGGHLPSIPIDDSTETSPVVSNRHFDRRLIFWIIFIGMIVVDQLVKAWVRHVFQDGNLAVLGGKPWPGVFEITLTYNRGIAFGMLQGHGILLAPVAVLMALFAIFLSMKSREEPVLLHIALALLGAGALGNLFDRLVFGKVTDMFYFRPINFPVFNVADACITVSAILLLYIWSFESASHKTAENSSGIKQSTQ